MTLQPKEIRIGNWFAHPNAVWSHRTESQGYGHMEFQWEDRDWYGLGECTMNLEDVKPIPLTEEWLERCGFYGRNDFKWIGKVGIQSVDGKYYFAFKDMGNVMFRSIVECKYVHALQNLYFALTGQELEFTP